MALSVKREDYEFLLTSEKFCSKIEKYINQLGLEENAIREYQEDNELLHYFFNMPENYSSCGESFTRYKIENMRVAFSHLTHTCKNSENYSMSIGVDLGLEVEVYTYNIN